MKALGSILGVIILLPVAVVAAFILATTLFGGWIWVIVKYFAGIIVLGLLIAGVIAVLKHFVFKR